MSFSKLLQKWFDQAKRELPWRDTNDAYRIWLSEVILQQTRVSQGLPYYLRFLSNYPTIQAFAAASEEEILQLWQGLGYYSRGRNMLKCAKRLVDEFDGEFPKDWKAMRSLPGIGDYTASAILSFAYDLPHAVVDGNVYRVLARVYGIDMVINTPAATRHFKQLAQELLDTSNPANHNQAIMEFGALQCTPTNPNCAICPLQQSCIALRTNTIDKLPVKKRPKPRRKRYFNYLVLQRNNDIFIRQRKGKGIWENLYEFPLIESEKPLNTNNLSKQFKQHFGPINASFTPDYESKHVLSHQEIYAVFWLVDDATFRFTGNSDIFEVGFEELELKYALPVLISRFLEHHRKNT
ncbi:MAG: A/G-specific adenine glycosylase [Bacteroidia bacterium]|nr:A/G-specific adenine glycosylase [Bacteroidia bacterium]